MIHKYKRVSIIYGGSGKKYATRLNGKIKAYVEEDENQLSKRTYFAGITAFLAVSRSISMAWVPFSIDSFLRL